MRKQILLGAATLLLLSQQIVADAIPRRATMTGGGSQNGKCTVEVNVDREAQIEVSGDSGLLRTLSGEQALWRRFQCNGPLPRNPADFRFVGIDGRGQVRLVRDPRSNRGTAVVYINDPKGGREGYTFDLLWRGEGRDSGPSFPLPPTPPGRGQSIQNCQDAVTDRLTRDGYRTIAFERTIPENNPGRNDWVSGTVTGRRKSETARFSFSCSVDFSSGRVRSVDVRTR